MSKYILIFENLNFFHIMVHSVNTMLETYWSTNYFGQWSWTNIRTFNYILFLGFEHKKNTTYMKNTNQIHNPILLTPTLNYKLNEIYIFLTK